MPHPTLLEQQVKTNLAMLSLTITQQAQNLIAVARMGGEDIYTKIHELEVEKAGKPDIHKLKKYMIEKMSRDEKVIRRIKLTLLREANRAESTAAFRNDLTPDTSCQVLRDKQVWQESEQHCLLGRMMSKRLMGKASFMHLQDTSGSLQIYLSRDTLGESYQQFKQWDVGDILWVKGNLFKTERDELTLNAEDIQLVTKSLLPLPDKFHGLKDTEQRYRQRYLDLISNEESRQIFRQRSKITQLIRDFFVELDFLEVETPMMQSIPGGASAEPFITHHNALDIDLYLRISPELYLKRLVVGGFERVFEINRSFRNEGLSTRHNPEFTMIEFYQAYATYHNLMDLTQELFKRLSKEILQDKPIVFEEQEIFLDKEFRCLTMKDAVLDCNGLCDITVLDSRKSALAVAHQLGLTLDDNLALGKIISEIFEQTVESKLIQATFITEYPIEVSPLARRNDKDPTITDRFELFIAGREIANGFSELNDPDDQAQRFTQQVKDRDLGDEEAMFYDEDYITALQYGMPPTAGEGIGIDRLVMLLTNCSSIKDVILFPQLRRDSTNG